MFCHKCSSTINTEDNYCNKCGNKLIYTENQIDKKENTIIVPIMLLIFSFIFFIIAFMIDPSEEKLLSNNIYQQIVWYISQVLFAFAIIAFIINSFNKSNKKR